MRRHPFRKSFGLFVLYSLLIIGIFVLQFRNESVVSKNAGLLTVSFGQTQQDDGQTVLNDSLQVNFKGISFFADEVNPAKLIVLSDESEEPTEKALSLVSYTQGNPLSFTFTFTENVSITFSVSDTKSTASLSINSTLPENAEGLFLNYKPTSGFSVTEKSKSKLLIKAKNLSYTFSAPGIDDKTVYFSKTNRAAYYALYNEQKSFRFSSIDSTLHSAQESTYTENIKKFRESLVASVESAIQTSQTLSEKSVIAYIAELASQRRYAEAVNAIPDSFKKGNKRTYLSAPYFNTLDAMYPSLEMHANNIEGIISNAADSSSLSIFTIEELADFMIISPQEQNIRKILALPAQILAENEKTVELSHATGILRTYLRLSELHSDLADSLLSVVEPCVKIIEAHCTLSDSTLMLVENALPTSSLFALETGKALVQYGTFSSNEELTRAGYALVNSTLSTTTLDSITLADAYPILFENIYYPHVLLLKKEAGKAIWAWTCANSISYSIQDGVATLSTKFFRGESHYIIVSGIEAFSEIEIYGLSFHSDPRFESYNSSGFIYRDEQKALLLKSRHKSDVEVVRLSHKQ